MAQAIVAGASVGNVVYEAGRALLRERGMVEIAALVGYYSLVAFTLRLFEVEPECARLFARPAEFGRS